MTDTKITIIGSGMGSLVTGALLTKSGQKVRVLEQNYLPGGCTTSYWRKGFVFESGATTLVGLGENMPLQHVLDRTGIELNARKLELPMQVSLANGKIINRYEDIGQWIHEAENAFGAEGQRGFWETCFAVSKFVWKTSLKQRLFPPTNFKDLIGAASNLTLQQLRHIPNAFKSMTAVLKDHGLLQNKEFVAFVNEQLLITAQNHIDEVNFLFGATALCYTNFPNYYIDGGLLQLVQPFVDFIEGNGGEVLLRESVERVERNEDAYKVHTNKSSYDTEFVVSGIPINNTLEIFPALENSKLKSKLLRSDQLNSAFQMGIGFKPHRKFKAIHHQIHLTEPLPETASASIFISLSHSEDRKRSDTEGLMVMSVSTHSPDPGSRIVNKEVVEDAIIVTLEQNNFLKRERIIYKHASTPKSWAKWTGRKWGFVGGYPQYMNIKPWQMLGARLDGHKAYLVGDTAYPGQGIPGVTLSGIIAVEKMLKDWKSLKTKS